MSLSPLSSSYFASTPLPAAPVATPRAAARKRPDMRPMTLVTHKNQLSGNIPGFLNFLYFPFYLASTAKSYLQAKALGDVEGQLDARLRLAGMPLNIVNSVSTFITFFFQAGNLLHILQEYSPPAFLMFPMNIAGIVLCAIEGFFEMRGVERQLDFLNNLQSSCLKKIQEVASIQNPLLKEVYLLQLVETLRSEKFSFLPPRFHEALQRLKNSLCCPENREQIARLSIELLQEAETAFCIHDLQSIKVNYLVCSSKDNEKIVGIMRKTNFFPTVKSCRERHTELTEKLLQVKILALSRRVQPWSAEGIRTNLDPILTKLRSQNPELGVQGRQEAKELLSIAKTQAKKLLIIHAVSFIALMMSSAAFFTIVCSVPALIPLVLLSAGGTLGTISYFANSGWLKTAGWKFSVSYTMPTQVKRVCGKIRDLAKYQTSLMQQRFFQNTS